MPNYFQYRYCTLYFGVFVPIQKCCSRIGFLVHVDNRRWETGTIRYCYRGYSVSGSKSSTACTTPYIRSHNNIVLLLNMQRAYLPVTATTTRVYDGDYYAQDWHLINNMIYLWDHNSLPKIVPNNIWGANTIIFNV